MGLEIEKPVVSNVKTNVGLQGNLAELGSKKMTFSDLLDALKSKIQEKIKGKTESILLREKKRDLHPKVLGAIEELLGIKFDQTDLENNLRPIAEGLQEIAAGNFERASVQARQCLYALKEQFGYKWLGDLVDKSIPLMSGGQAPPRAVDELYQRFKDGLVGDMLNRRLRLYQKTLRLDVSGQHDPQDIKRYIRELKELGLKKRIPEAQIQEAVRRLRAVESEINVIQSEHIHEQRGERPIHQEQLKKWLTPDEHREFLRRNSQSGEFVKYFSHLDENEVRMLCGGIRGARRWLSEKIFGIYGTGRTLTSHPNLIEEYQFQDFKGFIEWVYGPDQGKALVEAFEFLWKDRQKMHHMIKTIMYEPGDPKDKLFALRKLLGADVDGAASIEFAKEAITLYDDALMELQETKTTKYYEAVKFLQSKVRPAWNPAGQEIAYDDYYMELRKRYLLGQLDGHPDLYQEYLRIDKQVEIAAKGTILTDEEVLVYNEAQNEYIMLSARHSELVGRQTSGEPLSDREIQEKNRIEEIMNRRREQMDKLRNDDWLRQQAVEENEDIAVVRGYSPLEREARRRLLPIVEKTLVDEHGNPRRFNPAKDEWQIREAIFAARVVMIGTGHMAQIGSVNVIKPMEYKDTLRSLSTKMGQSVMWAPFMEDVVRIINPDYFAERFAMGPWGDKVRRLMEVNLLHEKKYGVDFPIEKTQEWQNLSKSEEFKNDPEARMAMAYMEFAKHETGIVQSELLREHFFSGGGAVDATTWRMAAGLFDEIKKECEKNNHPSAWRNMALGIQFALLGTKKEEEVEGRRRLLLKMLDRNPSKIIHLLGGEVVSEVRNARGIDNAEWQKFMRGLSVAEVQLYKNWDLADRDIVFRAGDFETLLAPHLRTFGIAEDRTDIFKGVLMDLYQKMIQAREVGPFKRQYRTMAEALARHNFPMTLTLADLDWGVANFFKLGTTAFDRRGRDIMNMAQTRDIMYQILYRREFISPVGEKGVEECIKKFDEFKQAFNAYASTDEAEIATKELVQVWIQFNRGRATKSLTHIAGWFPGFAGLMKKIGETELEHIPLLGRFGWFKNFIENNNLMGRKIKNWPHSIAEAVSLSVRYFGPEANDWDVHRIDHIIDQLQGTGIFAKNEKFYGELRRKFHTTSLWRMMDIPRKYWWVVIGATIAVAVAQSLEEEKKQSR